MTHPTDAADPATRAARWARAGTALVVAQFALIGALAWWGAPVFLAGAAPAAAWLAAAAGVAVGAWALSANRPGNFNIRPAPRAGGRLVESGPYRWIRHPMYTSVLLFGLAAALAAVQWAAWAALAALAAVLHAKAALEERWMALVHPGYAAYRARTRRFVPGVW